jgi:hypothetical protein
MDRVEGCIRFVCRPAASTRVKKGQKRKERARIKRDVEHESDGETAEKKASRTRDFT